MARRDWFCEDVLSGKLEIRKVWEDERVLAFHHPQPAAEIHVVVIPKRHVPSLLDPVALDGALLSSMVRAIQAAARELGLDQAGVHRAGQRRRSGRDAAHALARHGAGGAVGRGLGLLRAFGPRNDRQGSGSRRQAVQRPATTDDAT